jgi:hypothetical protein
VSSRVESQTNAIDKGRARRVESSRRTSQEKTSVEASNNQAKHTSRKKPQAWTKHTFKHNTIPSRLLYQTKISVTSNSKKKRGKSERECSQRMEERNETNGTKSMIMTGKRKRYKMEDGGKETHCRREDSLQIRCICMRLCESSRLAGECAQCRNDTRTPHPSYTSGPRTAPPSRMYAQ